MVLFKTKDQISLEEENFNESLFRFHLLLNSYASPSLKVERELHLGRIYPKNLVKHALLSSADTFECVCSNTEKTSACEQLFNTLSMSEMCSIHSQVPQDRSYERVFYTHALSMQDSQEAKKSLKPLLPLLSPTGMLFVSYHSSVYWSQVDTFRTVFLDLFERHVQGNNKVALNETLDFIEFMKKEDALYFKRIPVFYPFYQHLKSLKSDLIIEELLQKEFSSYCHTEIKLELEAEGLHFLNSVNTEYLPFLKRLKSEFQALYPENTNPHLEEEFKDLYLGTETRQDLYVKDKKHLSEKEKEELLSTTKFAICQFPNGVDLQIKNLHASLCEKIYYPLMLALASGPKTFNELISIGKQGGHTTHKVSESILILLAKGDIEVAQSISNRKVESIQKWNSFYSQRLESPLLSPITGTQFYFTPIQQVFIYLYHANEKYPERFAIRYLKEKQPSVLENKVSPKKWIHEQFEHLKGEFLPTLKCYGIL